MGSLEATEGARCQVKEAVCEVLECPGHQCRQA